MAHKDIQMKQSHKSKGKHIYPRVYQIGLKAEPLNRINLKTKLSEEKKDRKLSSFQREGGYFKVVGVRLRDTQRNC